MLEFSRGSLRSLWVLLVAALLAPMASEGQDLHPSRRPSPMGMARVEIGDTFVSVVYSRPYKRNRDNIFGTEESGALVPFGKIWRTGANEATQFTTTRDILVAGQKLPAGTYSLFTTPGEKEWSVHFNKNLMMWGEMGRNPETGKFEPAYDAANNALTVTVPVGSSEEEVDQFTILLKDAEGGADLVFSWIKTEVHVPIAAAS